MYVGSDDEIGVIQSALEHKAARYSRHMDPMSSKAFYADDLWSRRHHTSRSE